MHRGNGKVVRGVAGAVVFGALCFGASQAFAASGSEWAPPGQTCFQYCTEKYGEGTQPVYHRYDGYQWLCSCIP
jgi:hypothetical protein